MPDHYDALETRDPAQRVREEATSLPGIIARAMSAPRYPPMAPAPAIQKRITLWRRGRGEPGALDRFSGDSGDALVLV